MSMKKFKRIACLFDFNEESRRALVLAGAIALHGSAHLYVFHFMQQFASTAGFMLSNIPTYHNLFVDWADDESYRKALFNAVHNSLPLRLTVTTSFLYGARVPQIVSILRKVEADIFVMGIESKAQLWKLFFTPSIVKPIIRLAPCPVLTITKNMSDSRKDIYANL
jgi:nucleotide-binding universal stress UspA family protein